MPEEEGSFKVTDRRRGHDASAEAERAVPSSGGNSPPVPPSAQDAPPPRAAPPAEDRRERGGAPGAADLSGLFAMFASSALIALGEAPDPATGERHPDLDQAREVIDILLLLREKTRGNLTAEEGRLLEDVLYDLQMRFVRVSGRR